MLKILMATSLLLMVFFNGCAEADKQEILKNESNYTPSEQTIWTDEQK